MKEKLIKELNLLLENRQYEKLLKLLKESINYFEQSYALIEKEWENTKKAEQLGLSNTEQSFYSFKSYFKDFVDKHIINLPEDKFNFDNNPLEKTEENEIFVVDNAYGENIEIKSTSNKRPRIITFFCVLFMISIFSSLFSLITINKFGVKLPAGYLFFLFINIVLLVFHIVGLWRMKKWFVYIYIVLFIIGLISRLLFRVDSSNIASGLKVIFTLLGIGMTLFYWYTLARNYNRMT